MGADGRLDISRLPADVAAYVTEYRYLRIVPVSHDTYLDTDPLHVRWVLGVDAVLSEDRHRQ